jgi:transposase-like protein
MLNSLLDAEAEPLVRTGRYERSADRQETRAGHYERRFDMKAVRIKLQMPKMRKLSFETSIFERYKRRESSVEEALISRCILAGVLVRRMTHHIVLYHNVPLPCFYRLSLVQPIWESLYRSLLPMPCCCG